MTRLGPTGTPASSGAEDVLGRQMPYPLEPQPSPLIEAGTLIQQYEIIRLLGRGGMGEVFLARDPRLGRLVAIKIVAERGSWYARRFLAEAHTTARLNHENIVTIHDFGQHESLPFMVLEHLKGKTLRQWLDERQVRHQAGAAAAEQSAGLAPSVALKLMIPVVRALACAHQHGVVHRDLKPSNIFLTETGSVKVLDFGIAKLLNALELPTEGGPADPREAMEAESGGAWSTSRPVMASGPSTSEPTDAQGKTASNVLLGTKPYMAPEQWEDVEVDPRADLWAVGLVLAELLLGRHPLAPLSRAALASVAELHLPMPRLRELLPELGQLASIVDRCLIKRREDRLGSAEELLEALTACAVAEGRAPIDGEGGPYVGLSPFQKSDAGRYFGRAKAITQALGWLEERPLLAVVGPSGAGKSSFVRAGLIPALPRSGDAWEVLTIRPGTHPLLALCELLSDPMWRTGDDPSLPAGDADGTRDREPLRQALLVSPGLLGIRMRARARRRLERILLFVDQFEELYTLASEEEREAFLACLSGIADDTGSPLRVVLTLRADFLDRVTEAQATMLGLVRGLMLLPSMDRGGLREALVEPLAAVGYSFRPPELCEAMLDELEKTRGALPLLQFTAARLWEQRDKGSRSLTEETYRALGGVAGTLKQHADAVLGAMSPSDKQIVRSLFLRLVTPERTRALSTLRELCEPGPGRERRRVLDRLLEARLVILEGNGEDESTVELVHESLIDSWPALWRWLEEEQGDAHFRDRLRRAAREWGAAHEAPGLLWRGESAEEARRWQRRLGEGAELRVEEARYLGAVVALDERERMKNRRIVATVIVGLALVVLLVGALALRSQQAAARAEAERIEADSQRAEAQQSALRARNATRMAAARERQGDPTTALALLREVEPGAEPRGWRDLAQWAWDAGVARAVLFHDDAVRAAAWSPDGRRIVSASWDKTMRVWNADGSGQPLVLRGNGGAMLAAAWSPDGRRIASASWDKTVQLWHADGSGPPLLLRGHEKNIYWVAWSPDGQRLASASADKTVRVWNADGAGPPLVLRGHGATVLGVAWSPDGRRLVSASMDKTVRVWNADGSGEPLVLRGHEGSAAAVAWSPDGRRFVSASYDKTLRVWNADGSGPPLVLRGHENALYGVAWSPDGQRIVSASEDRTVRVWNADGSGQPLVLRGHQSFVEVASFSPDGQRIVSASQDGTVRVWSANRSGQPLVLRGHERGVNEVAWSPDGQRLATASSDRTVRVWNADGSGEPLVLRGHEDPVTVVAWSPDGRRLASGAEDKTMRVWSADGAGQPLAFRGSENAVYGVSWSPDSRRLASGSTGKVVRVWNADGSGEPLLLWGHEDFVTSVAWSPDGRRLASASEDKTVGVWNADGSGEPLLLRGHDDRVKSVAWSPDGRRLVSASMDKTVRVWNADGSGESLVLRGHEDFVSSVKWSPDQRHIVSGSVDKTVRVWNADGSGEPVVLRGPENAVYGVAWSPDGRRIAAASNDATVIVWNHIDLISGAEDPRLWTATTYCPAIEIRQRLLNVSEEMARADLERCQRRVSQTVPTP